MMGLSPISLCHLSSLALGVFAWSLPVVALLCRRLRGDTGRWLCGALSALACAAALYGQILGAALCAEAGDCSALLDTLPASAKLSLILLVGTAALDLPLLRRGGAGGEKKSDALGGVFGIAMHGGAVWRRSGAAAAHGAEFPAVAGAV